MARKLISIAILVSFLLWSVWYIYSNLEDFTAIQSVKWTDIAFLTAIFAIVLICNAVFMSLVASALELRINLSECLSLSAASSFANYFLPFRSGAGLRGLYLSKYHNFPLVDFIATLGAMYLMQISVNSVLALFGMALIVNHGGPSNTPLFIFFGAVAILSILATCVDFNIRNSCQRFPLKQLERILSGWQKVRLNGQLLRQLWLLNFVMSLATILQSKIAIEAVSVDLTWAAVFVYSASKNLAALISLTPGSLGIVELTMVYLGTVLGYSTSDALMIQGLIRSVAIVVLLLLGPAALFMLKRNISVYGGHRFSKT